MKITWNTELSENFTLRETVSRTQRERHLISPVRAYNYVDGKLVTILQLLRNFFNKPINVNSWYRTPEYNKLVSESEFSLHLVGKAADIYIKGMTAKELYNAILIRRERDPVVGGIKGLAYNKKKNFVHLDIRYGKELTTWLY